LNMAAVCRTRVGGGVKGGEGRRRNVRWWWTRTRGGVVPSKLVKSMFVLRAAAPLRGELLGGLRRRTSA
jgi:hypothetical protein